MCHPCSCVLLIFLFIVPAPTEIYTLSLHDALPIWSSRRASSRSGLARCSASVGFASTARSVASGSAGGRLGFARSEEHTSELQSRRDLVCRLLLEKKK